MLARPSRRDVIVAASAAGFSPLLNKAERLLFPEQGAHRFAFFSDTHVSLTRNLDENTTLLREIAETMRPQFAINGGDIVEAGWKGEFDRYAQVLKAYDGPVYHVPGNHDVRWSPLGPKIFRERFGPPYRSFDRFGCHFALLDTTVPLSHWGHIESAQLRWLERDLKKAGREVPVFLAMHHWVGREQVMVDNEAALLRILEPYNVKLLLTAHGHSDLLWRWDGMLCTMNKGLYQGSYERVEVDSAAGEIRLSRRTAAKPELQQIATVPLKPGKEKRPNWRIPAEGLTLGSVLSDGLAGATAYRWNEGKWAPIPGEGITSGGLVAGENLLSLRESEDARLAVLPVSVADASARLTPVWRRKLSGGVMSHLLISGNRLFVSAMDGSVHALSPETGKEVWRARTGGYCHSSPVVHGGKVFVGSADGGVYAFDSESGKQLWKAMTQGPVYASAALARGVAIMASGDGSLYGLDEATGKPVWVYALPASDTAFAQSPAATDGDRVFIGAWDRHLYCLDAATGALLWKRVCADRSFAYSPAIGGPSVANGAVFVPANGNELYAFRCESGEPLWKATSPGDKFGYSGPCVADGRIFIGCLGDKGEARCLSAADGKEVWRAETGAVIYDSPPAVSDGLVAIGSVNGTLSVLSAMDGAIVGQYHLPAGHFLSSPAMRGRSVFAGTYSDVVMRLDVRN